MFRFNNLSALYFTLSNCVDYKNIHVLIMKKKRIETYEIKHISAHVQKKKTHMNTKKVFKLVNQIKDLGELLVEHPNS